MATRRTQPARKTAAKTATTVAKAPATKPTKIAQAAATAAVLAAQARYDAAGTGRRMRGWMPPSSGPNTAIQGLQNIRNRSRDAVRNDWTGKSGIQHWTTNLIGTGIVPRLSKKISKTRREAIMQTLTDWMAVCDADNVLNFYGIQNLATRAWLESGEVFARLRYRRVGSGLPVGLQIQLIESDFVPVFDADNWPGMPQGNRIRSGIELSRTGQRVAFWVYREHPGDNVGSAAVDRSKLVRVLARDMLHIFEPTRPGQLRGVPDFASVLARLRNVADFDDAVLERQKLANLFASFIKKPAPMGIADGTDPVTGMPLKIESDGSGSVAMEPGMTIELEPGEEMQFANPPEAGTTYSEYMRGQNIGTAAGQGLPYEIMSGDIKEVSDRTLRVIINEFRRYAEQRQWQIVIPMLCQKVIDAWAEQAALEGVIRITEIADVRRVTWAPQGWAYIHPVQDAQGKKIEVEAGFRSRSSVIAERGDDPEQVDEERAEDHEREETLNLLPEPVPVGSIPAKGDNTTENDNIAPNEYPRNRALDGLTQTVARLETLVLMRANEQTPPPSFTINNHIPQTSVAVTNEVPTPSVVVNNDVAAPVVSVTNEVPVPAVTVTNDVLAPVVNVTNELPAPEVTVNLPDRRVESTIERDASGNIVNVTQVESTVLQ